MLADRYEVRPLSVGFEVYDSALRARCSVGGVSLVFEKRSQAAGWLRHCYRTWGTNPDRSENPPERSKWGASRWRGTPAMSPWTHYTTPVSPSERPYWA